MKIYKKFFSAFLFLSICSSVFSDFNKVISSKIVPFKEISLYNPRNVKGEISRKEFLQDVENLCYIIEVGYSGYEDMCENGFDVEVFRMDLISGIQGETIQVRDFYNLIGKLLSPYVQDGHFQLLYLYSRKELFQKSLVFWSNVYLENRSGSYVVIESDVPEIKEGAVYLGFTTNLFYYPVRGEKVYRLGKMAVYEGSMQIEEKFDFDGDSRLVKLEADTAIESNNMKYREIETDETGYVVLNSLTLPDLNDSRRKSAEIIFKKFAEAGAKFSRKKNVILDLRGNQGGDSTYAACFLYSLYSGESVKNFSELYDKAAGWNSFMHKFLEVYSPVTEMAHYYFYIASGYKVNSDNMEGLRKNPVRVVCEYSDGKSGLFDGKPVFNGKLIILTDRNDCSAGEFAVYLAKEAFGDKVFVAGENSAGMLSYYDVITLGLPNSGIGVHTALKKEVKIQELDYWDGEGYGMLPDIWSKGEDLNETIFLLTGDSEMKEKLSDIGNRLM